MVQINSTFLLWVVNMMIDEGVFQRRTKRGGQHRRMAAETCAKLGVSSNLRVVHRGKMLIEKKPGMQYTSVWGYNKTEVMGSVALKWLVLVKYNV